jgi:hypothetical protein
MADRRRPISVSPIRSGEASDNLPQSVDELVNINLNIVDNHFE